MLVLLSKVFLTFDQHHLVFISPIVLIVSSKSVCFISVPRCTDCESSLVKFVNLIHLVNYLFCIALIYFFCISRNYLFYICPEYPGHGTRMHCLKVEMAVAPFQIPLCVQLWCNFKGNAENNLKEILEILQEVLKILQDIMKILQQMLKILQQQ